MLSRLSLGAKLTSAFVAVAVIAAFIGFIGWNALNAAKADLDQVATVRLPSLQALNDITAAMVIVQKAERALVLGSGTLTELETQTAQINKGFAAADKAWKTYEALPHSAVEQGAWSEFAQAWNVWAQDNKTILDLLNQRTKDSVMVANTYATTKSVSSSEKAEGLLRKLVVMNNGLAEDTGKASQARLSLNTTILLGAMALGVFMALLFGLVLSRSIARGIGRVVAVASEIAEGDLTQRIKVTSSDEIGRLTIVFNHLVDSLHDTIEQIAGSSDRVASASEQLSATAEQFSSGVDVQLQQSQQIAAAMHEMSSSVLDVAKNAQEAASAAKQASDTANNGSAIVGRTIEGIKRIALTVEDTAGKVAALGESSSQIGDIIETIDDIADQTNLLALNAAIEAARAGEQGRGFAVVADEVRKLAERTTKATKEIAAMITTIQKETQRAVQSMEGGRSLTAQGVEMANQAESALHEIVQVADRVGGMVTVIAAAAEEQSSATEEINASVENITSIIRQTGEGARQSARATEELAQLALDQQSVVGKFKLAGARCQTPENIVEHPKLKLAV